MCLATRFLGSLGSFGPFYAQQNTSGGSGEEQEQEEQRPSLAELSRQYLLGEIDIEEYLACEQLLSPHFEDPHVDTH